jgi:HD-GYP domain-containing protein (c-di-GMP phosphodiesterase class II)
MQSALAPVDVSELLVVTALASDLSKGLPPRQSLSTCLLAHGLASRAGLSAEDDQVVHDVALLRFAGCTATAAEMGAALGDEIALSAAFATVDGRNIKQALGTAVRELNQDERTWQRLGHLAHFVGQGQAVVRQHEIASCEVAQLLADRFALTPRTVTALGQVFERWDGRGNPGRSRGVDVDVAVRVVQVAFVAELLLRAGGPAGAREVLTQRAGGVLDPALVAVFCTNADDLAEWAVDPDVKAVIESDQARGRGLSPAAGDRAIAAVGALADMKSPWLRGHSDGVARLAHAGAINAGFSDDDAAVVRRAGWLHDVGRAGVSSLVWNAERPLRAGEWEEVRLHAYHGERVLSAVPSFAAYGEVAGRHHERMDGSGYHRGADGQQLDKAAALLAAADVAHSMAERRPHRPPLTPPDRQAQLRAEVDAGRLAEWAVDAVLGVRTLESVASDPRLTQRETEVLALVARGHTNRAVGRALGISPKTVNTHLEHVYTKLGVTSRAAAAYHAVAQGLLTHA